MKWRIAATLLVLSLGLPAGARADTSAAPFGMPMDDGRIFAHLLVDQFEARIASPSALRWDAQAWVGTDENRLYLLTEGEVENHAVMDGQHELLYDHPISSFFDVRAGIRNDADSARNRTWAALGISGLAPYFLELSATLYASDSGHYAARAFASNDLLLTQRLVLTPTVELNIYSKADPGRAIDSGLSGVEAGLRLRYEITRKFAPYLGVSFERKAVLGHTVNNTRLALGIRTWL